jgi:osmoprotectant transport system permease protein
VVSSKAFTESVILGEIMAGLLESEGIRAIHRRELGGTRVLWNALLAAEIDVYADYTGTLLREVLAEEPGLTEASLEAALERRGVGIAARLGFNNGYVLGMRAAEAERLGITRISDLRAHPGLRLGVSSEFVERADGWPGLRAHYGLPHAPHGLHHDLAYRGIGEGHLDVIDLYSTDAEIAYYRLRRLEDDQGYFPRYDAVILYRKGIPGDVVETLARLHGALGEDAMVRLNAEAKLARRPESAVAADFLGRTFGKTVAVAGENRWQRIAERTQEHLRLVALSLGAAIIVAIPLGIAAYLRPRLGEFLLAAAGVLQTIPSLALLVFMIPWFGIGAWPAIAALFLYSLLPVIRNTVVGLRGIPQDVRDSAVALGLPTSARLRLVELPLAGNAILAGIKTAAVLNMGTATLGALIGAGGYGEPILTGIRRDDLGLILEGAIPAATLAVVAQVLFEWVERRWMQWGLHRRKS